jgi:hypothetical protein
MNQKASEYSKIASTGHELFHGLQSEYGQGGASVYNEIEADVFSYKVADNWSYNTNYIGSMSSIGQGQDNLFGTIFSRSFNDLTKSYSDAAFLRTMTTFKNGSDKNISNLYINYPWQLTNQRKSLLKKFYPK